MSSRFRCFLCLNFKRSELKNYDEPAAIDPPVSHRFPTRKNIRSEWIKLCGLDEKVDNTSGLLICSKHFRYDDYVEVNARKFGGHIRLKREAVPKLLIPRYVVYEPKIYENSIVTVDPLQDRIDTTPTKFDEPTIIGSEVTITSECTDTGGKDCEISSESDDRCESPKTNLDTPLTYIHDLSPLHLATTRRTKKTLQFVKDSMYHKNLQIKTLKQKNRRLLKKVQRLQDLIKDLRKGNSTTKDALDAVTVREVA